MSFCKQFFACLWLLKLGYCKINREIRDTSDSIFWRNNSQHSGRLRCLTIAVFSFIAVALNTPGCCFAQRYVRIKIKNARTVVTTPGKSLGIIRTYDTMPVEKTKKQLLAQRGFFLRI